MGEHRKRVKHLHQRGDLHEFTFSCYRRLPLLTNDTWRAALSDAIGRACERFDFQLVAFVFMPEHVHLLTLPTGEEPAFDRFLAMIKRPVSAAVKSVLLQSDSPLLAKLTVRERPGKTAFRFWQEGPGYDRNLRSEEAILASIDYIHANPVRRRLCRQPIDWFWSSAAWYAADGEVQDPQLPPLSRLPSEFGWRASR
ncbi:MAG: hypothetical protein CMJ58_00645 [Planctomycetaceae bacterium]|nr:hypothetical protein [Planctomycetaceae bacterium]